MKVIQTKALTKSYRRFAKQPGFLGSVKSLFHRQYLEKAAVSDFDLEVERGEFVGLIGRNGAGKTTLVKLLTGIVAPTSGQIDVLGYYPNKLENSFKKQYAVVMGQKSQLFPDLTPADTFLLFRELYEIPDAEYRRNLDYFTDLFDASRYLNVQVRTLSLGERMKMELIVALLHDPGILFLDEPTIGLDAVAQKQVRTFLGEVNATKATTILLTSHYMEDIQSLCDRCVLVEGGRKIHDGSTEALFERHRKYKRITLTFENRAPHLEIPPGCAVMEQGPFGLTLSVPRRQAQSVVREFFDRCEVKDVAIEEEDIGSVVERIYQEEART